MNDRNPFSARFHAPGALPWLPGESGDPIPAWTAAIAGSSLPMVIAGPHGSGKSTLACAIGRYASRHFGWTIIRSCFPNLPAEPPAAAGSSRVPSRLALHILDGLERAPRRVRRRWLRAARRDSLRVLATLHRPRNVRVLVRTAPSGDLAWNVVRLLLRDVPAERHPSRELVDRLFLLRGGNLRALLFDLYDWWEVGRGKYPDPRLVPRVLRDAQHFAVVGRC